MCSSIALQGYVFTKFLYSSKIHVINNTTVKVYTCKTHFTVEEKFIKSIAQFTFGFWIPLFLTIFCHFLMYKKLRKQPLSGTNSASSLNYQQQLRRITVKFIVIICAFYTCILPLTIVETYITYQRYRGIKIMSATKYHTILSLCTLLMNCNSSLNPLIYANVHLRLYASIRWFFNFEACFNKLPAPCIKQTSVEIISEGTTANEIHKKAHIVVELERYSESESAIA